MRDKIRRTALILSAVILFNHAFTLSDVSASESDEVILSDISDEGSTITEEGSIIVGEDATGEDINILDEEDAPEAVSEADPDSEEITIAEDGGAYPDEAQESAELTEYVAPATSGKCGTNATWSYANYTLTIAGSGDMDNYTEESPAPWAPCCKGTCIKLVIGDKITSIGDYAFYKHAGFTDITIGKSVKSIGAYSFAYIWNGTDSITFPASLELFNVLAFYNSNIGKLTFLGNAPKITDKDDSHRFVRVHTFVYHTGSGWTDEYARQFIYTYLGFPLINGQITFYPLNRKKDNKCGAGITWEIRDSETYEGKKKLVISGTGPMYDYALSNAAPWIEHEDYKKVKEIEIGNGITYLGNFAFIRTAAVKKIYIPSSVKTIGDYTFFNADSLDSFCVAPNTSFEKIGSYAFYCLSATEAPELAAAIRNTKSIGTYSFFGAESPDLEHLELNAETIELRAFSNSCVKSVTLGKNVRAIRSYAFESCDNLTKVNLGTGVKKIEEDAFFGITVDTLDIPDSLTDLNDYGLPKVRKRINVGKGLPDFYPLESCLYGHENVDIHFSSDCLKGIGRLAFKNANLYFPVNNRTWYESIDSLTPGYTSRFIPEGDPDIFTVKFVTGCDKTLKDQTVSFGSYVKEPSISSSGYLFDGWYKDSGFKTRYDFGKRLYENVTLYAKWVKTGTKSIKKCYITGFESKKTYEVFTAATQDNMIIYASKADFTAKNAAGKLEKDKDYRVSYLNNYKAGTATIVITGIGNYRGTIKKHFKILPFDINADGGKRIKVDAIGDVPYTKGGAKPYVVITHWTSWGETIGLTKGTDYTLSYKKNKKPGNATVTIKFKGDFKGSLTQDFKVVLSDISSLEASANYVYAKTTPGLTAPVIAVYDKNRKKLTAGTDYSKKITYVYAGKTTVHRYKNPKKKSKGLEDVSVSAGSEVSPLDIIPAGTTIKAIITGKGNYTGTMTVTFRVISK